MERTEWDIETCLWTSGLVPVPQWLSLSNFQDLQQRYLWSAGLCFPWVQSSWSCLQDPYICSVWVCNLCGHALRVMFLMAIVFRDGAPRTVVFRTVVFEDLILNF